MEINKSIIKKHRWKSNAKETGVSVAFLSPFIINFILFSIIPIGFGLFISFFSYDPRNPDHPMTFVGLSNYKYVFDSLTEKFLGISLIEPDYNVFTEKFWESFKSTLLFDIVVVPFIIVIPLILAYLVNMNPPGHKIFRAIFYVPSVVSISIVGIIFGSMFSSDKAGFINSILGTEINFLTNPENPTLRWVVILIASIWWQTGGNFIIFLAALKNVPKTLYEACEIDGGNKWKAFTKVTLPNIKGSISICLFTTIIGYLGLYGQVIVFPSTGRGYDSPMQFIQEMLSDLTKGKITGYITAIAVVFGLITMFFTAIEKICMAEKKKGDKYGRRYKKYYEQKENA